MIDVKKKYLFVALCAAFSPIAHAQSSVTLYGVVDASLLWQNHADSTGGKVIELTNGDISHSRWGLEGKEDLGGGMSAIFNLQGGFNPQDGTLSDANTLFNREAYVGLDSPYGELTVGRRDTPYGYINWEFDALTVANYNNNTWWFFTDQAWWANSVFYTKTIGPVSFLLDYAPGGVPGSISAGSKFGGSLWYTGKDFALLASYEQLKTTGPGVQKLLAFGANYTFGAATLYAGFQNDTDGTGSVDATYNTLGLPEGTADVVRRDQGFYTGISYQLTPAIILRQAYYYSDIHNALRTNGFNGMRWTAVSEAEYAFSKSTSVYVNVDYTHTTGAADMDLPDSNNQTEVGVGFRHRF